MPITVVGSIAFDTVATPFGRRERMLGGAATHFALAASFFDEVRVVGPVGDDFDATAHALLSTREINTDDVEHVAGGKSFFWAGAYGWDLNSRETLDTQLGVFETCQPKLSAASRQADVLFLANMQPSLQRDVLDQCDGATLRQAMAHGSALASFSVEEFGTDRVVRLSADELHGRVAELHRMRRFEHDEHPAISVRSASE